MNNIVFFGDSFTEASNNNFESFVSKMQLEKQGYSVKNYGVGGTTFAQYSLYPVEDNDLLSLLYKHRSDVVTADIICLEYGINDFAAVAVGYIRNVDVQIAFTKCVDYITQINKDCKIIYLAPSFNPYVIQLISHSQEEYLVNEYLNIWEPLYNTYNFIDGFLNFIHSAKGKVFTAEMIHDSNFMSQYIDPVDHIHPNDTGYQVIAEYVLSQLNPLL